MAYTLSTLCARLGLAEPALGPGTLIRHLSFDSRRIVDAPATLFFALSGQRDGHDYLDEAHLAGIRNFVVKKGHPRPELAESTILEHEDPLGALQSIAAYHRDHLTFPVLGITGSNGKTVVKEWLFHLLSEKYTVGRSPKSYNSQIGLPLSVWQLNPDLDLALIEAGISTKNEMSRLAVIARPQLGLFTGIGAAHDEGFADLREKIREKLKLFEGAEMLVYPFDQEVLRDEILQWAQGQSVHLLGWSKRGEGDLNIHTEESTNGTYIDVGDLRLEIPFKDAASIDNACSCLSFLIARNEDLNPFMEAFKTLPEIEMRLQLMNGHNNSRILNDAYSADLSSLEIALQFLKKQAGNRNRSVILSSLQEEGRDSETTWNTLRQLLNAYAVNKIYLVGKAYFEKRPDFGIPAVYYESTRQMLAQIDPHTFRDEMVLVKGRRDFAFEKIVRVLEAQVHETVLEIDLNALERNFLYFKNQVKAGTKIMPMVKAQGYGSGSLEIARQLQTAGADYLGVAYTDEGIELRRNGISLPIMVMNARRDSLAECVDYALEPVVYDFDFLHFLKDTLDRNGLPSASIHLEFDTGMHRLGFQQNELEPLLAELAADGRFKVASVFSHLAAADEKEHDAYTLKQIETFGVIRESFLKQSVQTPLFHILNTAGILRFSSFAFDMVRLGIGLYGIEASADMPGILHPVASLKAKISQIRALDAGETVGYSRKGQVQEKSRVAVISIGYADGFRRSLSNGRGAVWINGKLAPTLGNVCMDMVMVDVSAISCKEGDAVEIFGLNLPIEELARRAETIPYEIITGISSRVNRVYFRE
ncbi:MAG TPA: bifunctional UDP-N-acetylmuramoyl-tripeptide:D-alanyl-D-alanine ligase/alanine racemase [Bacteroidetes bacterium]|nr:bifunctional UDP-N-acetylmuramoyl-tripeptide:D-alanyl-D-alanine ligase/alanine racemase [Bacteroidota bacterium]